MEENSNLTAERSLEIITEQIAQSRKSASRNAGQSLFIAGLCIIGIALLVSICYLLTQNMAIYLLYALIPVLVIGIDYYLKRNKPKAPASFVGSMVDKTWQTFGIFALSFFVLSFLFNRLMLYDAHVANNIQIYFQNRISPLGIILLMMGMAITINGYILKARWLVWCGIIGGIGGFFWDSFCVTETILARCNLQGNSYWVLHNAAPNLIVALFALVGLMLPGWMIKKQK